MDTGENTPPQTRLYGSGFLHFRYYWNFWWGNPLPGTRWGHFNGVWGTWGMGPYKCMAENTWLWHWAFFQPPKNWSFCHQKSFLSLVGEPPCTSSSISMLKFSPGNDSWNPWQKPCCEWCRIAKGQFTQNISPAANLVKSNFTSSFTCQAAVQDTTTKTATPDLCDKANGAAHMQIKKPADSWQIYRFSTAQKGLVVSYHEVEYVSKYYRHSGYVTTQSKTRASTISPPLPVPFRAF